jgi:hypothetical protein
MDKRESTLIIDTHYNVLITLAKKYLWWQNPEEAISNPERVLAGAMNLGSFEDYQLLVRTFRWQILTGVLKNAAPGWFSPKSWSFWHRILELTETSEPVPPPPHRACS